MRLEQCLDGFVAERRISREQAEELLKEAKRLQREHERLAGETAAEARARAELAAKVAAIAKRKRYLTALHVMRSKQVFDGAAEHTKGFTAGAMSYLARDIWEVADHQNVDQHMQGVRGLLHSMFGEALEKLRPKLLGLREQTAELGDFVHELYGRDTGNAVAKAAAQAWRDVAEYTRVRFNRAGGDIGRLVGETEWRLPQIHDAVQARRMGYAAWRRLFDDDDISLMMRVHEMTRADLELELQRVYETVASDGMNKMTPGAIRGRRLAEQHQHSRFLLFASPESWLRYNEDVGGGGVFRLLTSHLDMMARDIARLEILGPNPDAVVRAMVDMARRAEALKPPPSQKGKILRLFETPQMIQNTYDVLSGRVNTPVSEWLARLAGGTRNILSMAQLGSAPISAVTDFRFLHQTAAWNGLNATRAMRRSLRLLDPANAEDRRLAVRLGLIAESWTQAASSAKRFQDEVVGSGWTVRMVDAFHRASGLTPLTQANKHAFGLEFLATLGENAGRAYDELDAAVQRALVRGGVTPDAWDAARRAGAVIDADGALFLDPVALVRSEDPAVSRAGQRLHELVLSETDFAIPEPDARARAVMSQGSQRGTLAGELWRSTAMYKSFSVSIMATHLMRGTVAGQSSGWTRARYAAHLLIGLTVLGAFSIQLRQIAQGKDPRPMDNWEFWAAALMQSGGLGILGDFVFTGISRADTSLGETIAGPAFGLITDVGRLTSVNMRQWYEGRETGFTAEALRFVGRYMPGSNLWYSRLAVDRLVKDQLQRLADPRAAEGFTRLRRRALRDYGQEYYWRPGDMAPARAPDVSAALGAPGGP